VPSAHLGDSPDPFALLRASADDVEPSRTSRWVSLGAIAIGFALVLFGLTSLRGQGSVAAVNQEQTSASAPTSTSERPSPAASVADGDIVVIGDERFAVGVAGDRVVVGDWDCDGVITPAVLRPSTGAVFVFDGLATEGADVSVAARRTVVGAIDVRTQEGADWCSTLVVVRNDGTEQEIS
jgi:hypothetical protein